MELDLDNTSVDELISLVEHEYKTFRQTFKPIIKLKENYKYLRFNEDTNEFEFTDVRFKDCIKNPYRYVVEIYFSNRVEEYCAPTIKELKEKSPVHIPTDKKSWTMIYNGRKV